MTTLRDDGYLETSDAVVAACFIEHTVDEMEGHHVIIEGIFDDGVKVYHAKDGMIRWQTGWDTGREYPILIPAAVVYALITTDPEDRGARLAAVIATFLTGDMIVDGLTILGDWLRTHTAEEANSDQAT